MRTHVLFFMFLIIFVNISYSQIQHEPGHVPENPRKIKIYAHLVKNVAGTMGPDMADVNTAIDDLKSQFSSNSTMIEFEFDASQTIVSDDYVVIGSSTEANNMFTEHSVFGYLNIFLLNKPLTKEVLLM